MSSKVTITSSCLLGTTCPLPLHAAYLISSILRKEAGVLKSEATVLREAHVNLMIKQKEQASAWERAKEEKMRDVEKAKEERTDSLEKR